MVEEQGIVVSIPKEGRAVVSVTKGSACVGCSMKKSCNLSLETGQMEVEVDNPIQALPGNKVLICVPAAQVVKGSLIGYLMPAFSMIVGAVIGSRLKLFESDDVGAIVFGFLALLISLTFVLQYERIFHKGKFLSPMITKVISA